MKHLALLIIIAVIAPILAAQDQRAVDGIWVLAATANKQIDPVEIQVIKVYRLGEFQLTCLQGGQVVARQSGNFIVDGPNNSGLREYVKSTTGTMPWKAASENKIAHLSVDPSELVYLLKEGDYYKTRYLWRKSSLEQLGLTKEVLWPTTDVSASSSNEVSDQSSDSLQKLPELKVGQKVYLNVTITKIEPDGIRIVHEGGAAKIDFSKLDLELQKSFGYDPAKAKEYAVQRHEQMRESAKSKASQYTRQRHQQLAIWVMGKVVAVLPDGIVVERWKPTGAPVTKPRPLDTDAYTLGISWTPDGTRIFLEGAKDLVDGEIFNGNAAEDGTKEWSGTTVRRWVVTGQMPRK